MEIEVYYYSKSLSILSTQQINLVATDQNFNDHSSYMTTRGAVIYNEAGVVSGKITSNSSWHIFNNESEEDTIRNAATSIKTDKGIIYGIWSVENPKKFIGDNVLTIKPSFQSNYYYGKNITFNIEQILDTDVIKITIFISSY
jgi:hypothetical protein